MRSPIRCSRNAAATPPIIRRGTRSTATRPTRPRRSCSAKRAPARRPCGCRWPAGWRSTTPQPQNGRLFVIQYDDFNPFLDHFADRLSARKQRDPARVLAEWKLWDHMDAILSLGVTSLVDRMLGVPHPERPGGQPDQRRPAPARSTASRSATCLLLAACYDDSLAETCHSPLAAAAAQAAASSPGSLVGHVWLGLAVTAAVAASIVYQRQWDWLTTVWPYLIVAGRLAAVAGAVLRSGTSSRGGSPGTSACSSRDRPRCGGS